MLTELSLTAICRLRTGHLSDRELLSLDRSHLRRSARSSARHTVSLIDGRPYRQRHICRHHRCSRRQPRAGGLHHCRPRGRSATVCTFGEEDAVVGHSPFAARHCSMHHLCKARPPSEVIAENHEGYLGMGGFRAQRFSMHGTWSLPAALHIHRRAASTSGL